MAEPGGFRRHERKGITVTADAWLLDARNSAASQLIESQRGIAATRITYPLVGCGAWWDMSPDLSSPQGDGRPGARWDMSPDLSKAPKA